MEIALLVIFSIATISIVLSGYCEMIRKKFDKKQQFSLDCLVKNAVRVYPVDYDSINIQQGITFSFTPESTIMVQKRKFYNYLHVSILVHELAHFTDYHRNVKKWNQTKSRRLTAALYIFFMLLYAYTGQFSIAQGFQIIPIIIYCGAVGVFGFYLENLISVEIFACKTVMRIFDDKLIRRVAVLALITQIMDNIFAIALMMVFFYIWLGFA